MSSIGARGRCGCDESGDRQAWPTVQGTCDEGNSGQSEKPLASGRRHREQGASKQRSREVSRQHQGARRGQRDTGIAIATVTPATIAPAMVRCGLAYGAATIAAANPIADAAAKPSNPTCALELVMRLPDPRVSWRLPRLDGEVASTTFGAAGVRHCLQVDLSTSTSTDAEATSIHPRRSCSAPGVRSEPPQRARRSARLWPQQQPTVPRWRSHGQCDRGSQWPRRDSTANPACLAIGVRRHGWNRGS